MTTPSSPELKPRAKRLLRALIAQYLADGEPVGSRTLAQSSGLEVSSATIRHIMADLEEVGLLTSPHTSAGRIPTPRGLRLFLDSLVEIKPLSGRDLAGLRQRFSGAEGSARDILDSTSSLLSAVTHFVGVVTVPGQGDFPLRHIDFVALSGNRALVILVFADNRVENRVVQLEHHLPNHTLEKAANYLNAHFAGLRLDAIRARLLEELRAAGSELNSTLSSIVELAAASFAPDEETGDVVVSGQTNLMGYEEMADLERLRHLFEAFQRKREMLQLMEMCAKAQGVQLFIGDESGYAALEGCSVVTANYGSGGRILGSVGVIGPTRMAYDRIIPVVQATAGLLSDALARVAARG